MTKRIAGLILLILAVVQAGGTIVLPSQKHFYYIFFPFKIEPPLMREDYPRVVRGQVAQQVRLSCPVVDSSSELISFDWTKVSNNNLFHLILNRD